MKTFDWILSVVMFFCVIYHFIDIYRRSKFDDDDREEQEEKIMYVNEIQYNRQRNLRDLMDGELNRIAVTADLKEIDKMVDILQRNILKYAEIHRNRIKRDGVYDKLI